MPAPKNLIEPGKPVILFMYAVMTGDPKGQEIITALYAKEESARGYAERCYGPGNWRVAKVLSSVKLTDGTATTPAPAGEEKVPF